MSLVSQTTDLSSAAWWKAVEETQRETELRRMGRRNEVHRLGSDESGIYSVTAQLTSSAYPAVHRAGLRATRALAAAGATPNLFHTVTWQRTSGENSRAQEEGDKRWANGRVGRVEAGLALALISTGISGSWQCGGCREQQCPAWFLQFQLLPQRSSRTLHCACHSLCSGLSSCITHHPFPSRLHFTL